MSTTLSNRSSDLLADQLIAAAGATIRHARLFLGEYMDVSARDLFERLLARADTTIAVSGLPLGELRALRAGSALLIPFLIDEEAAGEMNSGTEGYASKVRGRFAADAPESPVRVLLFLADDPIETIGSAGDQAGLLPALAWPALCSRAAELATGSPASSVVAAAASDIGKSLRPSGSLLRELLSFAIEPWVSAEAAARELFRLGIYVSAPEVAGDPGRLSDARGWRTKLERFAEPGADLEGSIRKELGDAPVVDTIIASKGPRGIDYSAFTLGQLEAAQPAHPPRLRRPVSGYKAQLTCANGFAIWLEPAGSTLVMRATGNIAGARAEMTWADGETAATSLDETSSEVRVHMAGDGWRFGELTIRRARVSDSALIAAYFGEGNWFPVEASTVIDLDNRAFHVEGEAAAYLVGTSRNLGRVELDTSADLTDTRVVKVVERGQEEHQLPIYLQGEGDESPGPEGPEEPPEEVPEEPLEQVSPIHAMIVSESADVRISERGDRDAEELEMTVGGRPYRLASQEIGSLQGLRIERQILNTPDTWAFTAGTGQTDGLRPDPSLERLALNGIPQAELRTFQKARHDLFKALLPFGSAYAAVDDAVRGLAAAYVNAYARLLESLPRGGHYQPENDRILLADSILLTDSGERFIAPTNPLTVAYYLNFWSVARDWIAAGPRPSDADLRTVSPRHLLPLLNFSGIWHEAVQSEPFLWRRYQPLVTSIPAMDYDDRFIARKLDFFISVHPAYFDPDQVLSVSLYEPGDGVAVVKALERFYWKDLSVDNYTKPRLQINLLSRTGTLPAALGRLVAGAGTRPIDHLVRSRVTVTSHKAEPHEEFAALPFSHLTFVHRTTTERRPGPVSISERASTMFVAGLSPASRRAASSTPNGYEFHWGTFGGELVGRTALSPSDLEVIESRSLELVGGQSQEMLHPGETRMLTTRVSAGFMREVYRRSVWVVHMERLIGLELFEPQPGSAQRYLIQYEESFAGLPGLDGITATEHVEPYHKALKEALSAIPISREGLDRVLRLLNAVAGGWALDLLHSGQEDVLGMIGVTATIAALQDLDRSFEQLDGVGVLISVREMLEVLPAAVRPPDRSASDDLVFLWVPFGDGIVAVSARLIEVKFSTTGRPVYALARQQLENTKSWLESTFNTSKPERLFRSRDLSEFIRAAVTRNRTFGLGPSPEPSALESALGRIAAGEFELRARFWVGGRETACDVVSVELESDSDAVRGDLPGAGESCGLIRLGRRAIEDLADGRRLTSSQPWENVTFASPGVEHDDRGTVAESNTSPAVAMRGADEVEAEVRRIARELDAAVIKYDLELEPFRPDLAQVGPSVIRFRTRPLGRQALDGVARRAADLGREVGVPEGVLVGQEPYYIRVDVPRRQRQVVLFSDYLESLTVDRSPGALNFLLGIAPSGQVAVEDIARLPHLLIAGATGSGKSILLRSILCSLLLEHPPDELKIFLVDPKQIDFLPFEDIPHLVNGQIVTDPVQAVADLQENIEVELSRRRPILKQAGVTNALEYYEAGGTRKELPQMVIIVDEFADLASALDRSGRAAFMSIVQRYGQLTRAFGIYLVLATQRPSVQVITGDIKANLTARVALKLQAPQDSVTILGHAGAESLRDKGDLIFEHGGRRERLQGFFVRGQDISAAISRWPGRKRS
jgi:hypothetical protein